MRWSRVWREKSVRLCLTTPDGCAPLGTKSRPQGTPSHTPLFSFWKQNAEDASTEIELHSCFCKDSSQDLTESSHCRAACQALPLIYCTLSLPSERTKTITSTATDWITWDHRKDIHPDKTALLAWCQGFETRLIPCLINEPHVGDSPLLHSCGQFPTYSLLVFPILSPPRKLKQLSRGYLEFVKTLFEDIRPRLPKKVNRLRSLHGTEHGIHRTEGTSEGNYLDILLFLCGTHLYLTR